MGVLLKNEASYSDCIQTMDEYENFISKWYTQSGRGNIINFRNTDLYTIINKFNICSLSYMN